jgi:hypothetical protein
MRTGISTLLLARLTHNKEPTMARMGAAAHTFKD